MKKATLELKHWMQLTCLNNKTQTLCIKNKIPVRRIFLGNKFPDVYFTEREAQCVYHLMHHKKRREIAAQLNLSIRTVEAYITEAKAKTKSHSQRDLVSVIQKSDFVKNYQRKISSHQAT